MQNIEVDTVYVSDGVVAVVVTVEAVVIVVVAAGLVGPFMAFCDVITILTMHNNKNKCLKCNGYRVLLNCSFCQYTMFSIIPQSNCLSVCIYRI